MGLTPPPLLSEEFLLAYVHSILIQFGRRECRTEHAVVQDMEYPAFGLQQQLATATPEHSLNLTFRSYTDCTARDDCIAKGVSNIITWHGTTTGFFQVALLLTLASLAKSQTQNSRGVKSRFNKILADFGFSDTNINTLSLDSSQNDGELPARPLNSFPGGIQNVGLASRENVDTTPREENLGGSVLNNLINIAGGGRKVKEMVIVYVCIRQYIISLVLDMFT